MDKCREEFEIFWTARCCGLGIECVLTRLINGDYYDIKAYYAWIGWSERQKSMQAIKFPDELVPEYEGDVYKSNHDAAYCKGYNDALSLAEDAITSAGYKVE